MASKREIRMGRTDLPVTRSLINYAAVTRSDSKIPWRIEDHVENARWFNATFKGAKLNARPGVIPERITTFESVLKGTEDRSKIPVVHKGTQPNGSLHRALFEVLVHNGGLVLSDFDKLDTTLLEECIADFERTHRHKVTRFHDTSEEVQVLRETAGMIQEAARCAHHFAVDTVALFDWESYVLITFPPCQESGTYREDCIFDWEFCFRDLIVVRVLPDIESYCNEPNEEDAS
ncbi:hypothetical protein BC629DRAFT_1437921 [Irpex lacteus]|nr:hypothetical protein BC629DRAFT_1437921 [Irpex lacteus]